MPNKPKKNGENNFITLLNFIADPAVIVDENSRFLVVNDALLDLSGLKDKDLIGTSFFDLSALNAENKAKIAKNFEARIEGLPVKPYEINFTDKNGAARAIEVKSKKLDYLGQVAFLVVIHDVTKRKVKTKQLEEYSEKMEALVDEKAREIIENKEKLIAIFNSSPDAIVVTDLNGKIVEVNEATIQLYGCSSKDCLIGKNVCELVPREEQAKLSRLIETILKDGSVKNAEQIFLTEEGRELPVEFSASFLKDSEDNPVGFVGIVKDISERKKAEEALRESEERFRQVAKNAQEWIWEVDAQGLYTYASPVVEKILGYKPEEIVGKKHFYDLFHPEDREELKEAAFKAFAQKQAFREFINRTVHKKGKLVWLSTGGIPILDNKGNLLGYRGSDTDITERKKAEEELVRLSSAVKMSTDSIVISGLDGTILDVNEATTKMYGSDHKGELIGKNSFGLIAPEEQEKALANTKEVMEKGYLKGQEYHIVTKDGDTIPVEMSVAVMKDADGKPVGFVGISRDITERKKTEATLRESEETYRELINRMNDTVWVIDFDSNFVDVNDAAVRVLGYSREELLSMGPQDIDDSLDAEQIKGFVEQASTQQTRILETEHTTKDGRKIPVEISSSLITYQGKPAFLSIARDISERKKSEEALKESEEKFRNLSEESPNMIFINKQGRVVYANKKCVELMGYTKEEFYAPTFNFLSIIAPESIKKVKLIYTRHRVGEEVAPYEYDLVTKAGKRISAVITTKLIKYGGEQALLGIITDITDRKQLENALRESEEMFRAISTSAMDAIILLDDEAEITYWNPAAEKIFGYTNEEAVGKKLDKLVIPPKYQGIHSKATITSYHKGHKDKKTIEAKALRKNGTVFPIELSITTLEIKDKKHVLGIVRDISERKKMETTLREAEKRYHALFNKAPLGILVVDETGTAVEFNEEAHRQLGYSREEFAKLKFSDYEVIETPEEIRSRMKKILYEGKDEFETKHRTKNGEIRDVIITVQVIELAGKKFFHLITRDITEQKKIEQELKLERDKLEAVTENIGAGLGIISKDYRILWVNQYLKQVNPNCEGKTCYSTFNTLNTICPDCGVRKVFEEGVSLDRHEYAFTGINGNPMWAELIATPLKDKDGNIIAALELSVDITEKKLLQKKLEEYSEKLEQLVEERTEQLKQAQAKLVKSERLAAIGELAAMVGHDLRNPLTGIMGAAYYLKTKHTPELGAKGKEMLETIEKAILYSNKIVNDLLEYSRDLKLELTETTPKELLNNALSLIEVPEVIRLVDATKDKPKFRADTEKMRRVFVNLIRNAFDAMPKGGTLTVKSREVKGKLEISFKDTGAGMSKETLSKLNGGVLLFTTKAKGMGFGVPICKRIAEAHGGKLYVESNVGKGTVITITVPVNPKTTNENEVELIFNKPMLETLNAKQTSPL